MLVPSQGDEAEAMTHTCVRVRLEKRPRRERPTVERGDERWDDADEDDDDGEGLNRRRKE